MSAMKRFYAVVAPLLLSINMTGCVFPRRHSALNPAWLPHSSVALLPVTGDDITGPGMPKNKLVRLTNEVLDTLAAGETHRLIGPTEVASRLDNVSEFERLTQTFGPSTVHADGATSNLLAISARSLGINQVVRTKVSLWSDTTRTERDFQDDFQLLAGMGVGWSGLVQVDMELIELSPAHFVRKASGRSSYGGAAGLVLLMVPVYEQTTVGRAIDNSCRNATRRLFEVEKKAKKTESR